jgi:hypothetical protein
VADSLPELIAAYAARMHRAASGHHILSPLGAWLLLDPVRKTQFHTLKPRVNVPN